MLNTTKSRAPPQPILLHMTQASPGSPWAIASVKQAMINEFKWSTKWSKWASNHLPIIAQTLCHVLHRRTDKNWCKQIAMIDRLRVALSWLWLIWGSSCKLPGQWQGSNFAWEISRVAIQWVSARVSCNIGIKRNQTLKAVTAKYRAFCNYWSWSYSRRHPLKLIISALMR